jgi:hypothetical protein
VSVARATDPPSIAPWQFTLRFALEVASLVALGAGARHVVGDGVVGWAAAIALPLAAAIAWGVFGVLGDTRGDGMPPVRVAGWARVAIEVFVLCLGAAALAVMERWVWFGVFVAALVVDHVGMRARIRWLLRAP